MGAKRYKIEIADLSRNVKATLTIEGDVPPQLAASLVEELSEKLSGGEVAEEATKLEASEVDAGFPDPEGLSMKDKIELVLLKYFQYGWFTSSDVHEQFTRVFGETSLSVVSTYLARFRGEGLLERKGTKKQYYYRLKEIGRLKASKFGELLQLLP